VAKRTGTPVPPERPRLTVTREEAAELIKRQIAAGQKVLDPTHSATSPDAYRELDEPWRAYTRELLRKLFTTGDLADEFEGLALVDGTVTRADISKI
jgi:hypothetical protein